MASQTVAEVMTTDVLAVAVTDPVTMAAHLMRDHDIGDVIVTEGPIVRGMVTDRDLVIRVMAEGMDPNTTLTGHILSEPVVTVQPGSPAQEAVDAMRQYAVRRLPVVEANGELVGVVTLGDLAMDRDSTSALADISAAPPDH